MTEMDQRCQCRMHLLLFIRYNEATREKEWIDEGGKTHRLLGECDPGAEPCTHPGCPKW